MSLRNETPEIHEAEPELPEEPEIHEAEPEIEPDEFGTEIHEAEPL